MIAYASSDIIISVFTIYINNYWSHSFITTRIFSIIYYYYISSFGVRLTDYEVIKIIQITV